MAMSSSTFTCRRRFLKMAAVGVAAAGCGSGQDSTQSSVTTSDGGPPGSSEASAPGDIAGGKASDLAVGSLQSLDSGQAAIARDSAGVYALTLICTHAGCQAGVIGADIVCPCHGATFDANGNVVHGPATAPLVHLAVSADSSGNLTVHSGTLVDPATRLML
jgi:Rieske Fe-S protein